MAQLTFRVGADTLAATTAMDRLTAKVQEMTVKVEGSGDKFTQLDRNAEQLAKRLGVELTGSTNKQIEAFKSLHDYLVKVGAPTRDVEAALKGLQAAQERYAEKAGPSFWDQHKTSILAAGTAIVGFGVMAVKAFEESQNAGAQLDAVLKSTAGAVGLTRAEAENLATSLSKLSGVDDEAILGAETILLQFTKIGKETFPAATQAVLDLSIRLGKDLPSAALMVGKALDNPVEGMQALQRATGKFTEAEVAAIKEMVETGHVMEAQAAVLSKLQEKFGGAAEAAGNTFSGAMNKSRVEAENWMEVVGGQIAPVLTDMISSFPIASTVVLGTADAFGKLNISGGELLIAIPLLKNAFAGMGATAAATLGTWGLLITAGTALGATVWALVSTANAYKTARIAAFQADSVALKATEALEAKAKQYGITIEKGTKTQEQYNAALFRAIGQYEHINTAVKQSTGAHTQYALEVAKTDKEVTKTVVSHKGLSDRMKQNAEDAKALVKSFDNVSESMIRMYSAEQNAFNAETFRPLLVDLPEGLNKIPPMIIDIEEAYKTLGITSTEAVSKQAEEALAAYEAIRDSGTSSARDIDLAWAKVIETQIARAKAMGRQVPPEFEKMGKEITDKWEGTAKEVEDVWSKQVSTIVTDFSKGIADIIFEGKSFADTMMGIFKQFGQTILRTLIESLFSPLKNLFKEMGDWLSGLFSGGGKGAGGILGGLGGILGIGAGAGGALLGDVFGGGVGGTIGGIAAGGLGTFLGGSFLGSAIGAGGGLSSGLAGLTGALGAIPVAGWIALGAAMIAGPLISKLTQRGREKKVATGAVEDYSDYIWKTVIPDMQNQAMGFSAGVEELQKSWDGYVAFLHANLKDQTVIQRSIDSQRIGLTQSMAAAAQIGIDQIRGTFDQIGSTRQVTDEMIANLQDIAKGMQLAGTEAQKATSQFALFAAQFLQTGKMTDDFAASIKAAGGNVEFFTAAASKIEQLQGLRSEFQQLKQAIDSLLPKQQSWMEKFIQTGEITDELVDKIIAAGGSIQDFKAYSDMRIVKTNFESLLAEFNRTGVASEQLLSYIRQYGDAETRAAFETLIKSANASGKSIGDLAKDNQDAARTIQSVMNATASGIDAAFTKSAQTLSGTLAKMDENLGKSIQALQDALVTMIKDLIDVILEIPGAAEKAQQDFNKFMGLLETPEIDPVTVSFVLDRQRWDQDVSWAATQAQQAFAAGNRVWGTGAGFPSQDIAYPTNPTRGAPTPRMAEGGLVFKPTLAIVGERGPEAIVPLNKAANLGNVYITVEKVETSDPEKFIDMLIGMAQTNRAGTKKRLKTVLA